MPSITLEAVWNASTEFSGNNYIDGGGSLSDPLAGFRWNMAAVIPAGSTITQIQFRYRYLSVGSSGSGSRSYVSIAQEGTAQPTNGNELATAYHNGTGGGVGGPFGPFVAGPFLGYADDVCR